MKVYTIGKEPFYIDEQSGERLKQAILAGAEYVEINDGMYKTSIITMVTNEGQQREVGRSLPPVSLKEIMDVNLKNGEGLSKFKKARQKLSI